MEQRYYLSAERHEQPQQWPGTSLPLWIATLLAEARMEERILDLELVLFNGAKYHLRKDEVKGGYIAGRLLEASPACQGRKVASAVALVADTVMVAIVLDSAADAA
jgi:hypothetical protein